MADHGEGDDKGGGWDVLLADLESRRRAAREMGGAEKLERQRAGGRLDARARVERLLDPGSFSELGTLVGGLREPGALQPAPLGRERTVSARPYEAPLKHKTDTLGQLGKLYGPGF